MQVINSKNNELVKLVKKLHYKRYRSAYGLFILEGILNFEEILGKSSLLDTAIFSETVADDLYKEFIKQHPNIKATVVSEPVMKLISQHTTTPGVLMLVKLPDYNWHKLFAEKNFFIYLDEIRDPGNLGAIIRSAWALGTDGVLLSKGCADPFAGKAARASMGGILNLPLLTGVTSEDLQMLQCQGYQIVVTSLSADSKEYHEFRYHNKTVIVIGNEIVGVNKEIINLADIKVHIHMYNQADSLNAASACAIIASEVSYQIHEN